VEKIKIRFDPSDNSLIVWFADPKAMAYLSPIEDDSKGDLHLIKDDSGEVIGVECHFYHVAPGDLTVEFETAALIQPSKPTHAAR
jgi:hypothetical protein